jgi:hypothetical protein
VGLSCVVDSARSRCGGLNPGARGVDGRVLSGLVGLGDFVELGDFVGLGVCCLGRMFVLRGLGAMAGRDTSPVGLGWIGIGFCCSGEISTTAFGLEGGAGSTLASCDCEGARDNRRPKRTVADETTDDSRRWRLPSFPK